MDKDQNQEGLDTEFEEDDSPDFREQNFVLWAIKHAVDHGSSLWDLDAEWYLGARDLWTLVYLSNGVDDCFAGTEAEEAEYWHERNDMGDIPF